MSDTNIERIFISKSNSQDPVVIVYGKEEVGGIGFDRALAPIHGSKSFNTFGQKEVVVSLVDQLAANLCLETPSETTHGIMIAELFGLVNSLNKKIEQLEQRIEDQNDQIRYLGGYEYGLP